MKLSNTFAKLTRNIKSHTLAVAGSAILAGAALTAAMPAAEAQHVAFGVTVGGPAYYYPPAPHYYGYYGPRWGYGYGYHPYYRGYYGRGYYGHGWRR